MTTPHATAGRRQAFATEFARPTRSAALLLLLAMILELLGRLISSTGVTIAAAAALGAVLGDMALTPRVQGLVVGRDHASRLTAGTAAAVRITVEAPAGRHGARRPVVVIDQHPALPPGRVVTPPLPAGSAAVAQRFAVPIGRGYWNTGGTLVVEAFSPLGGFVRRHTIAVEGELWVHPRPAPAFTLPNATAAQATGSSPSRRTGMGVDFAGVREWRSGDPATSVHWRASARRDRLVVIERERPAHTAVLVVVGASGTDAAWESALERTAATAVAAVRGGQLAALIVGAETSHPRTAQEVLDWFAAVQSSPMPVTALQAGLREAGRGAIVVWLSTVALPSTTAHIMRHGGAGAIVDAMAARRRS